ncbi:N5,N10-methylene tetrahydromethanopterin reductase [Actinoplanes italicus]|uniref:Luciferase-like monooxygenase n=1 Tax=Actinoplanes italicus TaxID=113567 RepID=A0A2T0KHJ5_9ACTN|nr:luciferase-like monooxygenase [Actinoplanes italicus]GIE28435.1 N5,N10-methylene tetrahydromethanopterin reductase [Actinoplanes italicus]
MLAALASTTTTATLGTGALLPFLRRPLQAAQALASIDLLSGGRLAVAVGAGFPGRFGRPFYALSEVAWPRRFARLDETVALWRAVRTGATSFDGEFFRHDDLPPATRPFREGGPPIWLGGATPAALVRAGRRYDGWLPYPPDPADYASRLLRASGLLRIHETASAAGRDAGAITPAMFVTVLIDEDPGSAFTEMEKFATRTYGMPLGELGKVQAVVTGTPAHIGATLTRYIDAGARHVVIRPAALGLHSQREQLERAADLIPTWTNRA